eukprot:UN20746
MHIKFTPCVHSVYMKRKVKATGPPPGSSITPESGLDLINHKVEHQTCRDIYY